jgi:hypothetical protein
MISQGRGELNSKEKSCRMLTAIGFTGKGRGQEAGGSKEACPLPTLALGVRV